MTDSLGDDRSVPASGDSGRRGWLGRATRFSGIAVGVAAFLIAVLVTVEVVARTLLGATTAWVNDVSVYLMGFITFVGAAYALAERAHVSVDVVLTRVGARTRRLLVRIADLLVLAVVATLAWLGAAFWWDAYTSGEKSWGLVEVALWIPYSFLAVGMLWLLVMHLAMMVGRMRGETS